MKMVRHIIPDKIRRWLVYKLGGIWMLDLPYDIQLKILRIIANNTIDEYIKDSLSN